MKEFENRMKDRLESEFYSKGLTLNEEKSLNVNQQRAGKRAFPFADSNTSENSKYDIRRFKVNLNKFSGSFDSK